MHALCYISNWPEGGVQDNYANSQDSQYMKRLRVCPCVRLSVCPSVCLSVPSEFLCWFLHGDHGKYKRHMNSFVELFSCEGISHPIISFVQDLSYWIPMWNTYEHSPKQKPNRKPSDYYRETYAETFANISAETFAEKEKKQQKWVSGWATSSNISSPGFKSFLLLFLFFIEPAEPSQAKPSQPKRTQADPSQHKPH